MPFSGVSDKATRQMPALDVVGRFECIRRPHAYKRKNKTLKTQCRVSEQTIVTYPLEDIRGSHRSGGESSGRMFEGRNEFRYAGTIFLNAVLRPSKKFPSLLAVSSFPIHSLNNLCLSATAPPESGSGYKSVIGERVLQLSHSKSRKPFITLWYSAWMDV